MSKIIVGTHSLPFAPAYFINRQEDLASLQQWLDEENKRVCVVSGFAGRGKTYLVAEFSRRLLINGEPEWIVHWVECGQRDKQVDLDFLLVSFYNKFVWLQKEYLKATAPEDEVEEESEIEKEAVKNLDRHARQVGNDKAEMIYRLDSLFQCLQSNRWSQRWLVVLNDYHAVEDINHGTGIKEFVKKASSIPGIKLIVVVKEKILKTLSEMEVMNACDELPLAQLNEVHALDYFRCLGLNDLSIAEAQAIWKKCCSGEPLLVNLFAGAIKSGDWTKQELLETPLPEWSPGSSELIDTILRGLDTSAREVAKTASIFTEPVEPEIVEMICDLPRSMTITAIRALAHRFLLDKDQDTGLLSFHQILGEYWRGQLDNQQEKELHTRAARWLETQLTHDGISLESGSRYLRRAFFHWRKAGDLKRALSCGKDSIKDVSLWEDALHSTGQMTDPLEILFLTQRIADIYFQSEEIEQADYHFQKTLETAQQSGHQQYIAMALHGLGRIAQQRGQTEEATQRYEGAKLIAVGVEDEAQADLVKKVVESFISLREQQAESSRKKKDYDEAGGFYLDAKHLAEEINNEKLIQKTGKQLGYFYFEVAKDLHTQADFQQAEYWKIKAVNTAKELKDKDMEKEFSSLTDPTGRSFLSYRRSRLHEAELLLAAQHERGIPTWQDMANLDEEPTEDAIRKALGDRTTANAVLWLTPDVAQSAFIRQIEAPLILQRARSKDGFFVVPVLAGGLERQQVASVLDPRFTIEDLEQWYLRKIDADPIGDNEARQVAKWVLRRRLVAIHEALPGNEPLRLELYTRMTPPFKPGRALVMDWSHRFDGREAKPGAWEILLSALADVEEAMRLNAPGRIIEAGGFPAIPAALALGSTFLAPRGMTIRWRQLMQDGTEQLWGVDAESKPSGFQLLPPIDRSVDATDLAVLVSVASNVESAFSASLPELPRFRAVLHITKPDADKHNLENPGQARHVAQLVVEAIRDARNRYRQLGLIHLFMAAPVGMAMMIGQLLSTFGPIQTYEHIPVDAVGRYRPSALLHPAE